MDAVVSIVKESYIPHKFHTIQLSPLRHMNHFDLYEQGI